MKKRKMKKKQTRSPRQSLDRCLLSVAPQRCEQNPARLAPTKPIAAHDIARTDDGPTVPFLRLSNVHIRALRNPATAPAVSLSSLAELGLYAILAAILSNPAFTHAPGGMRKRLLSHCKNRSYALHTALRSLQNKGFVCRTRTVYGINRFCDYYTLSDLPTPQTQPSDIRCLSRPESVSYLAAYHPYLPPQDDFTMVSAPMLFDPRLSLAAKGLYAVIAHFLRLSAYNASIQITKELLKRACPIGDNAFDRLFRELRKTGYLHLTRDRNEANPRGFYRYTLCMQPQTREPSEAVPSASVSACTPASVAVLHTDEQNHPHPASEDTPTPPLNESHANTQCTSFTTSLDTVSQPLDPLEQQVRAQIEYDCLLQEYPPPQLDCIVSIITSFLRRCQGKHDADATILLSGQQLSHGAVAARFSALDSEDIRYVLDTYVAVSDTKKIRNVRAYLTACLSHAKEDLALALDGVTVF